MESSKSSGLLSIVFWPPQGSQGSLWPHQVKGTLELELRILDSALVAGSSAKVMPLATRYPTSLIEIHSLDPHFAGFVPNSFSTLSNKVLFEYSGAFVGKDLSPVWVNGHMPFCSCWELDECDTLLRVPLPGCCEGFTKSLRNEEEP